MSLFVTAQESLADQLGADSTDQCVQPANDRGFCIEWVVENFSDRYVTPTFEHLYLVGVSVVLGFAIAIAMAVLSHRRRWLVPPFIGVTGVLYTIPSVAFFFLLLPITGRGADTALIALTAYNLQILYRNIVAGLNNVPTEAKDAGSGMGMTQRQLLWRVEMPLAVPEIVAGLRIATVSTVAIATLAVFANGGGLGELLKGSNLTFKTNIMVVTVLAVGMAVIFDLLFLLAQRRLTRWQERDAKPRRGSRYLRREPVVEGR